MSKYAAFSKLQEIYTGTVHWKRKNGDLVLCTSTSESARYEECRWPDREELGLVEDYVGVVSHPTSKGEDKLRQAERGLGFNVGVCKL